MTIEKFLSLIENPELLTEDMIPELKELTQQYPYFAAPHLLLAKVMHQSNEIQKDKYLKKAGIYATHKKQLYFLLNPDRAKLAEPVKFERDNSKSGNYFEMIEKVEAQGGDTRQSLKSLAERLKAAREAIQAPVIKAPEVEFKTPVRIATPDYFSSSEYFSKEQHKYSEEYAKKLIKEKKYAEAIEILNKLNLINPKKSIYFADQIRFLEKILVNTKKHS